MHRGAILCELLQRLVDAFADVVEVTRCHATFWLADGLLDLPTVLSKKGTYSENNQRIRDGCLLRYQQGTAVCFDESCSGWHQVVGGSKKTPSKVCRSTWDCDSWFCYMSSGWNESVNTGTICLRFDGVWLAGEDTICYNFLSPATDDNTLGPLQVQQDLSERGVTRFEMYA